MQKKLWSMFLVLCMVFTMLPISALALEDGRPMDTSDTTDEVSNAMIVTIDGTATSYTDFAEGWNEAVGNSNNLGATVQLLKDWRAIAGNFGSGNGFTGNSSSHSIFVPENKTVTLDLNGHTIDRGLTTSIDKGTVITVSGSLNVQNGTITGGNSKDSPGGFWVFGNATLSLTGCSVSGNTGTVGGIELNSGTSFTMEGGSVTGNTATEDKGGGIRVDYDCIVQLGGEVKITGNLDFENQTNNLFLKISEHEEIVQSLIKAGELRGNASIGISVPKDVISGSPVTFTETVTGDKSKYFTSDNSSYAIYQDTADNKIKLRLASDTISFPLDFTKNSAEGGMRDKTNCSVGNGHTHENSTYCWIWDSETNKLILNNLKLETTFRSGIILPGDVTVETIGENTVQCGGEQVPNDWEVNSVGIEGTGALTFAGNGVLNVTSSANIEAMGSSSYGVFAAGSITVSGGILNSIGKEAYSSSYGVFTEGDSSKIYLSGGTVTAKAEGRENQPFNKEPILSNGMTHDGSTGFWNNTAETACTYTVPHNAHCICGGTTNVGDHTSHVNVTFTGWNGMDPLDFDTSTDGVLSVYLTGNASRTENVNIPKDKTLNLCLNGKTLSGGRYQALENQGTLNLCDCRGDSKVQSVDQNAIKNVGTFTMYGGTLTGSKIGIRNETTKGTAPIKLYGGSITENQCGVLSLTGDVHLAGAISIMRNSDTDDKGTFSSNLMLVKDVADGVVKSENLVILDGPLTGGNIGINIGKSIVGGVLYGPEYTQTGFVTKTGSSGVHARDYATKFTADFDGTYLVTDGNELRLTNKPEIISGADQIFTQGGSSDMIIKSNADLDDFERVDVGKQGGTPATLEPGNYVTTSGSTIVTLKNSYLKTLAAGIYSINIVSKTGTASTTFTIKPSDSDGGKPSYTDYRIKISKEGSGTISPAGSSLTVPERSDKTFTFTPDKGYVIKDVLVDGKSVGAVKEYIFKNVTGNHTLKVIFKTSSSKNPQNGGNNLEKPRTNVPQTGDNSNMVLWIALLLVSSSGLTILGVIIKRRKSNQ